jgi:large subunit ribosomal protein L25
MSRGNLYRGSYHIWIFLRIEMEKEVVIDVPITVINDDIAVGVKEEGGVLAHGLKELNISCLPKDIPEHIELDIADLKLGESVKVADISLADNIKILNDPEEIVASITYSTQLEEEKLKRKLLKPSLNS